MEEEFPRLYADLATWWPLLSAPEDYAEEAAFYHRVLDSASDPPPLTLLELGSGGGNNASHLKQHYPMTLVDRSPGMLAVSLRLNPELEHVQGDMRSVRLERTFEAVFVHDAVMYLTSEADLLAAMETAFAHLRPGGIALFCPDCVRETFREYTDHGGHDGPDGRGLRYLEWTWDPDPLDSTFLSDFAYLLREPGGEVRCEQDRHLCGLFAREAWLQLLREAGFREARSVPFEHSEVEEGEVFLAVKPTLDK